MYQCMNKACGEFFDELTYIEEEDHFTGAYCPFCGGEEFETAAECENCHGYTEPCFIHKGMCVHCAEEAFTVDLGLQYLKSVGELENFVLGELWDVRVRHADRQKLIELFSDEIRGEEHYANILKQRVCSELWDGFIDFLTARKDTPAEEKVKAAS